MPFWCLKKTHTHTSKEISLRTEMIPKERPWGLTGKVSHTPTLPQEKGVVCLCNCVFWKATIPVHAHPPHASHANAYYKEQTTFSPGFENQRLNWIHCLYPCASSLSSDKISKARWKHQFHLRRTASTLPIQLLPFRGFNWESNKSVFDFMDGTPISMQSSGAITRGRRQVGRCAGLKQDKV